MYSAARGFIQGDATASSPAYDPPRLRGSFLCGRASIVAESKHRSHKPI